jgi:hypothetical protein
VIAQILGDDDRCRRLPILGQSWEKRLLNPLAALYRAIEAGLVSTEDDAGQVAGDALLGMAVERGFDVPYTELLRHAEHLAALADIVTWIIRPDKPWERPPAIRVGDFPWVPSSFVSGHRLRRLVLVDRWTDERAIAESHDWRSLEGALYGLPMDLLVVVIGQNREGRRHGPLTRAWLHSVNQKVRFRKRDGSGFDDSWEPIFREHFRGEREEWLESMTEDGVLADTVLVHEVPVPEHAQQIRDLAARKLERIAATKELPEAQLSACDDPIAPCAFRSCCPYWRLPSEDLGFLRLPLAQPLPHPELR